MSILKVNDIRRATTGSSTLVFNDPVTIVSGTISASVLVGSLPGAVSIGDGTIGKEKLTNDARDWVNILNKPAGLLSSSAQLPTAISGTFISPAGITASGVIFTAGTFSGSGAGLSSIPNSALNNSSITINGTSTALGASRTLVTADISESSNLYYTDARVKSKLNTEAVVSSSGQINYQAITGQPSVNTLGSDGNKSFTVTAGIFLTGSTGIDVTNDSANAKLTIKTVGGTVSSSAQIQAGLPSGVVSSSTQTTANLPTGTVSASSQYPGWVTASSQIDVRNTTGIATLVTTGSNIFVGNQTISGSTTITGNLTVQGTSSVLYVTSSQLDVGSNKLTLNTTTALRYGGINVYDSGSVTNQSGSLLWDSLHNVWLFVHAGTTNTSSIVITGPENTGTLGNEAFLTQNMLPKAGETGDHIVNSQISDNGTIVGIAGNLQVTGSITASGISGVSYTTLTNIPAGLVSSSGQVRANQTSNFTTDVQQVLSDNNVHSASFLGTATTNNLSEGFTNLYYTDARVKTKLSAEAVHSGSSLGTATTTNLTEGSNLYFTDVRVISALPTNTVSSSNQVTNFLPAGTISSSAQVNLSQAFNTASQALTASYALTSLGTTATNTDGLPEGTTNLYYTDARVKTKLSAEGVHSGSSLGTATTTNLTEGINLYFTNLRVVNALPIGTVSSSAQLGAGIISSSTQFTTLNAPFTGSFTGSFTGDGSQLRNIGAASLPAGTVSSSAQYPGWVTASSQIDYNSITNKLSGVISSSDQFNALVGTSASWAPAVTLINNQNITPAQITASGHIVPSTTDTYDLGTPSLRFRDLYLSGSTLYLGNLAISDKGGTLSIKPSGSSEGTTSPVSGAFTGSFLGTLIASGSQFSGIVSGSGTQYRLVIPVGTNLYAT